MQVSSKISLVHHTTVQGLRIKELTPNYEFHSLLQGLELYLHDLAHPDLQESA